MNTSAFRVIGKPTVRLLGKWYCEAIQPGQPVDRTLRQACRRAVELFSRGRVYISRCRRGYGIAPYERWFRSYRTEAEARAAAVHGDTVWQVVAVYEIRQTVEKIGGIE